MQKEFSLLVFTLSHKYWLFKLIPKETSKFMKFLYVVLLMKFWNVNFMTDYTTTILARVYMPQKIINTSMGYKVLRHEMIHIQDCYKTGFILFWFSYLFTLPTVFTMRAFWEFRAYKETLKVHKELYGFIPEITIYNIVEEFASSKYLWMCPFRTFITNKFFAYAKSLK